MDNKRNRKKPSTITIKPNSKAVAARAVAKTTITEEEMKEAELNEVSEDPDADIDGEEYTVPRKPDSTAPDTSSSVSDLEELNAGEWSTTAALKKY
jgi:hypothetical protein